MFDVCSLKGKWLVGISMLNLAVIAKLCMYTGDLVGKADGR
jgi:hypothetical protein